MAQGDEKIFKEIYKNSLTNGKSYEWLDYLSNQIGGRLSGSLNAERAVNWTKSELELLGLDKVLYLSSLQSQQFFLLLRLHLQFDFVDRVFLLPA